jgi:DNA-binding beta-propeller fold protein YncE
MDRKRPAPPVGERFEPALTRRGMLRRGGVVALAATGAGGLLAPLVSLSRSIATNPRRYARSPAAGDPPTGADVVVEKSLRITHGNAAHTAWSDDGRTLYLANEEGSTSNIKLDVSDPTNIRIVAAQSFINFSWAVDARHGVVLYRESIGGSVVRVDPQAWAKAWSWSGGRGHAVVSDGRQVYVPVIGNPAAVAVLDAATGAERQRLSVPRPWPDVYSMGINEDKHLLVVGAQSGGTTLFDTSGGRLRQIGQITEPASLLALAGTKL